MAVLASPASVAPHWAAGLLEAAKEGLVSQAYDVNYVSSRVPFSTHLAVLVKRACVRSLSCEVCPGGEGCIYFGDDVRGHALSYTFSLKDVHARGLKRWFSVLVLVRDRAYLLSAWTFMVQHIQQLVQQLQQRAAQVFDREGGISGSSGSRPVSDQPRRQRVISSRGLPELIDYPGIWERLHYAHVWLMLAAGERLLEVMGGDLGGLFVDSQPQENSRVEEDSVLAKSLRESSHQLEFGKSEIPRHQEKIKKEIPPPREVSESASSEGAGQSRRRPEYEERLICSSLHEESNNYHGVDQCRAEKSNYDIFHATGSEKLPELSLNETQTFEEAILYEDSDLVLLSARELYFMLGPEQFEGLLQHLTLGFLLEVRCSTSTAYASAKIVHALKKLVPSFLLHHIIVLPPNSSLDTLDNSPHTGDGDSTSCCDNLDVRLHDIRPVNDYSKAFSNNNNNNFSADSQFQSKIISGTIHDHTTSLSYITDNGNPSVLSHPSSGDATTEIDTTNNNSNITSLGGCKSKCSFNTLTSSPSVEVYDALDMDTLVLTITLKRPQQTSSSDQDQSSHVKTSLQSRDQRWSSVRRPPVQSVQSSPPELMQSCVLRIEDMSGRAVCPPQRCCSVVRALASACTNTALRDDTLHLTLRHTLHQWRNKARLWDALVKQHRTVGQFVPTSTSRRDVAPHDHDARSSSSSALGYSFSLTTPPLLPKKIMASKSKQPQQDERRNRPATTGIYPNLHASSLIGDSLRQVDVAPPSTTAAADVPSLVMVEGTLPVLSKNGTGQSSSVTSNPREKVGSSSIKLECFSGEAVFSSAKQSHSSNNNPNGAGLYTEVVGLSQICDDLICVAQCVAPSTGGDRASHTNNIDVKLRTSVPQQRTVGVPNSTNSDPVFIKPGTSSGPKPIPPLTGGSGAFGGLATVVGGSPGGGLSSSPGSYNGPSSHLTVSSLTVGVPVAVLQQMLLAVGAAENDVTMLQCWAYQSSATASN